MSSWVPVRTAPSEPLCLPSTSYPVNFTSTCSFGLRERRCGGQSHRGRALQRIRCGATQALHSYHNAFKLLHQSGRTAELPPEPDAPAQQEQRKKARPRPRPSTAAAEAALNPAPSNSHPGVRNPVATPAAITGAAAAATSASPSPSAAAIHISPGIASNGHIPESTTTTTTSPAIGVTSSNTQGRSNRSASTASSSNVKDTGSVPATGGFVPVAEDLRPLLPHGVSLPHWQPPPTSLQHRTALTRAISTCPSYTRLHPLILDNAADFNAYHTCAALSRVLALHSAGLTPRESRLFKEGCSTLQSILRRQLPELQPRALVVAAYSLARLELPDRELLAGLATAIEPHLSALQPQGLSSLLWAFARQSHQPPPKWMDAALSACAADLAAFSPRDMATVIWSLARLHYKVSPARLKQLLEHTQAQMGSFCGRSLSNVVYSLALSQQHPGGEWLAAAQARAVALGPDAFTPQGITQMAWGLAKLGAAPAPAFIELVLEHASQRLPLTPRDRLREQETGQLQPQPTGGYSDGPGSSSSSRGSGSAGSSSRQGTEGHQRPRRLGRYSGLDLATLMYALASLGAQPRADMGRRLLAAVQWELPSLEANGMCNCLWACARLRLYPYKMWMSVFFDASYRQMPYFKPVDLTQTLWALARLQASPPAAWMSSAMTRLQLSASMFSPVEVASTMWALARLGVRGEQLPAEVLALFFIATDRRLSSFKPQELSSMIWALAHMRRRPDKEWNAEFLKVTYHKLATMNGWCLATIAWSLAELSLLPPPAWMYSYVNAARSLMNAAPQRPRQPQLESGAAAEGGAAATSAVASAGGQQREGSPPSGLGLSAMDLGQIITALRRLNGSGRSGSGVGGGLAKVDEFLGEAEQRLGEIEAGSAAYARQQLGAFLAMSPQQAGLAVVPPPVVPDPSSDVDASSGEEEEGVGSGGAAVAAAPGARAPRRERDRRRRRATGSEPTPQQAQRKPGKWGAKEGGAPARGQRAATAAAAGRAVDGGVRSKTPEVTTPGSAVAVADTDGYAATAHTREVTRVLNGGARVTLAATPEVHVDLGGDLNVELPASASGPVLWRPAAAPEAIPVDVNGGSGSGDNGSGHGHTAGAAAGEDHTGSSTAEIKRRLLAV